MAECGAQVGEDTELFYKMFTGSQPQRSCSVGNTWPFLFLHTPSHPAPPLKARRTKGWASLSWLSFWDGVGWGPIPLFSQPAVMPPTPPGSNSGSIEVISLAPCSSTPHLRAGAPDQAPGGVGQGSLHSTMCS